jgi:hypothetical protein
MNNKIIENIMNKMWSNGGHWCELTMKKTGETLFIQRRNYESFERLRQEKFLFHNQTMDKRILTDVRIGEIADYIIKNYC